MNETAVTVREAQEILRLGKTKIFSLLADGSLRSFRVGKRRLIVRSSIDALFESAA